VSKFDRGYPLSGYGAMIEDRARMEPYAEAIRQTVKPGDVVLDIGAGTGIFAMIAHQSGAARIYAIEPNPAIRLAKKIIAANHMDDRIICIEGISTKLDLPEKANVIVSDLRSVLPLYAQHIPSIIDARERLLAPNGKLIPAEDTLYAAPVESAQEHSRINRPWQDNDYGLDLSAGADAEAKRWSKAAFSPASLLSEPCKWAVLDYASISDCAVEGRLDWTIQRNGMLHGIACWFDSELAPGIGFSNNPTGQRLIYGQAYMPLRVPLQVSSSDLIRAQIKAHWINEEYIWRWQGKIYSATGGEVAEFDQSTLLRHISVAGPKKTRRL
jgi:type I protein arginine methyltransferase